MSDHRTPLRRPILRAAIRKVSACLRGPDAALIGGCALLIGLDAATFPPSSAMRPMWSVLAWLVRIVGMMAIQFTVFRQPPPEGVPVFRANLRLIAAFATAFMASDAISTAWSWVFAAGGAHTRLSSVLRLVAVLVDLYVGARIALVFPALARAGAAADFRSVLDATRGSVLFLILAPVLLSLPFLILTIVLGFGVAQGRLPHSHWLGAVTGVLAVCMAMIHAAVVAAFLDAASATPDPQVRAA